MPVDWHIEARAVEKPSTRYEFDALPDHPLTLWLPLPALRKLFDQT
jgi:hypothetical protein